jgi:atypical dual specificity phosphatase
MLYNFSWVIPGLLAGSALPGWYGVAADDLEELARLGIKRLVSLTEEAAGFGASCDRLGLSWEHFPIEDFSVPEDLEAFDSLIRRLAADLAAGRAVCAHCYAGVGRTGLLLACLLGRFQSLGADEAIRQVRAVRPAIETPEQERFVQRYLERVKPADRRPGW